MREYYRFSIPNGNTLILVFVRAAVLYPDGTQRLSDYRFVTFVWFVVKFFYRELRAFDV